VNANKYSESEVAAASENKEGEDKPEQED